MDVDDCWSINTDLLNAACCCTVADVCIDFCQEVATCAFTAQQQESYDASATLNRSIAFSATNHISRVDHVEVVGEVAQLCGETPSSTPSAWLFSDMTVPTQAPQDPRLTNE